MHSLVICLLLKCIILDALTVRFAFSPLFYRIPLYDYLTSNFSIL